MATATVPAPGWPGALDRLIPVAIIVYVISFTDRPDIGFAVGGIGEDLHISAANQGLARGIFVIGHLVPADTRRAPGGALEREERHPR